MYEETINEWVEKARGVKGAIDHLEPPASGVKVIKRKEPGQLRGAVIMEIAEKIRPHLVKFFDGIHDENGQLLQPAHIRAFALNMAQYLVKSKESNNSAA